MTANDQGALAPVDHHGTHHKLVSPTEQRKLDPKLTLDAIVVPARMSFPVALISPFAVAR